MKNGFIGSSSAEAHSRRAKFVTFALVLQLAYSYVNFEFVICVQEWYSPFEYTNSHVSRATIVPHEVSVAYTR